MNKEELYSNLFLERDIIFHGLIVHPTTFVEILDYGLDAYHRIITPFRLTLDCIDFTKMLDLNIESVSIFKDVILQDEDLKQDMLSYLYLLFNKNNNFNITVHEDKLILNANDEDSIEIDEEVFDELSKLILIFNNTEKIKIEKEPDNLTEKQLDVYRKLKAGREESARRNQIHLYDCIIALQCLRVYIPSDVISNWTLFKIMTCYKNIIGLKIYDDSLKLACVSGESKGITGENHWLEKLKIKEV